MSIHIDPQFPPPQTGTRMNLEIVIPCVNYGDYLAETLPHTMPLFDRVIVVTSKADKETQEVARKCSCTYYATDVWFRDGGQFNKYAGLAFGLSFASVHNTWVGVLDADTYLPPVARQVLERKLTDPACIYGVDRLNCVGYDRWRSHLGVSNPGHDYCCRVPVPHGMPLGERIALREHGGWLPIGYFQMWHASSGRRYPTRVQGDAEHNDVLHAMQWEPHERILIPELLAIHLMADNAPLGSNWKGRKSPRFGPRR